MNNLPRQKLLEIIRRHGREIITEPRRCEGLMRDHFPAHRREIAVLNTALDERIASDLLNSGKGLMPRGALFARLAARLHNDVAMEASAARWTVHTWALALGVITPAELDDLEGADAQAGGQANERANERANEGANAQIDAQATRASPRQAAPAQAQTSRPPQSGTHAPPPANAAARSASPPARTSFVVALDGSGDFQTLTQAVRRAPDGSRLLVRPGIYNEGFLLDKSLEIIGEGALGEIVVRATTSSCLVLRTDAATIRNLTLRGQARAGGAGGDGFFAVDIAHGRPLFDGCDISSDSLACVAIHNPTAAPVIRNCHIHHGVDSGVFVFDGARGLIEACDIAGNSNIGIAVTDGASASVQNCRIHDGADAGVVIWNKATGAIEGCDIYANRRANVGISDTSVAVLRRCRIHDGDNTGVYAHRDGQATLEACNIYAHVEAEIAVTSGGGVQARNCQIHDGHSHGVFVHDAGRASLKACDVFRNRGSGVHVEANGNAVAHECRINDNGHVGVSCDVGGAVEVEGCDLTGNRVAAWLTNHGSRVVSRNNRLI
jgi:hypothetical protein